jgi:hypothetical protein
LEKRKTPLKNPVLLVKKLEKVLDRDKQNLENIVHLLCTYKKPKIDVVAVTYGPGLEIAL